MTLINIEELNRLKLRGETDYIKGWNMAIDAIMDAPEVNLDDVYNQGYTDGYEKGSANYENQAYINQEG